MAIYCKFKIVISALFIFFVKFALPMHEQAKNISYQVVCQLKPCPEEAKIGYLQGDGGELRLFESFIKQLMNNYSDNEKNIYCGF